MGEYKMEQKLIKTDENKKKKFKSKNKKSFLNVFTWHLIITGIVFLINIICFEFSASTYNSILWRSHFHGQLSRLILTNVVIYLIILGLYDIINWGYWKVSGIILVSGYTLYYMFAYVLFIEGEGLGFGVFMLVLALIFFLCCGKPGNIGDKIIDKYMEVFEKDRYATNDDIDMLSLRTYYTGDYEPYEVLYEQVGLLLKYDHSYDEIGDYFDDDEEEVFSEFVTASLSLDNPENNPLHPENKDVSDLKDNRGILDYIENNLRDDFAEDYKVAKNGIKDAVFKEKTFMMSDVEAVMIDAITELNQPDMLMTYCLIALYKNSGIYRRFSLNSARNLVTIYIQSGMIKYGDFFYDLIVLLNKYGITEVTSFEEVEIPDESGTESNI